MKKAQGLNKYIGDYEHLRLFLRYISYGCYHKSYLARKLWLSARSYEDNWARVAFFLPEYRLQSVHQGHREIHSLRGDSYQSAHNDLAKFYQIKTLTNSAAFMLLSILQTFSATTKPLSETELQQYWLTPTNRPYPKMAENISRSTLHRYLHELTTQGLLRRQKHNGHFIYQLADDYLAGLNEKEFHALQAAIAFYRNVALISVPGYFLSQTLANRYGSKQACTPVCQFKHTASDRILDDEVVQCLSYCIVHHCAVHFSYRKREIIALPQTIITDYYTGRQYLRALVKDNPKAKKFTVQQNLRIDRLRHVRAGSLVESPPKAPATAKHLLQFELYYANNKEKERLLLRLHEHEKGVEVSEKEEHLLFCQMHVADELKLMPWLRTFYPQIRIVGNGPANLSARMSDDIKEALANYGIRTPVS